MAIGYMHMSANGKASPRDMERYMERKGKYAKDRNGQKREDLVAAGCGNLPKWAKDADEFWKAEDDYRKSVKDKAEQDRARREEKSDDKINRREVVRCRRVIIALPAELDHNQQKELLESYLKENFPRNAYTWAIHEGPGKLSGKRNPHAHVLVCQKEIDPKKPEPSREKYFSQRGGYRVDKNLSGADRSKHLDRLKKNWERAANRALENARQTGRVRMGKTPGVTPSFHLGRRAVAAAAREQVDGYVPQNKQNRAVDAWKKIQVKNILERKQVSLAKERVALSAEKARIEKTKNPDNLGVKGWFSKWGFFAEWREEKRKDYDKAYTSLKRKAESYNRKLEELQTYPKAVTREEEHMFKWMIDRNLYTAGRSIGAKTRDEKIWDAKSPEEKRAVIERQAAERKAAREKMLEESRRQREQELKKEKEEKPTKEYTPENRKETVQTKTKTRARTTNGRNRGGWDMGR